MVWLSLLSPPTHTTPSPTHSPLAPRTENPWHNEGKHLKILDFVYLPTRWLLCNGSQLTRVATTLHTAGRAWSLVACSVPPDISESSITTTTVSKETEAQAESVICPSSAGEETAVWLHVMVSICSIPSSLISGSFGSRSSPDSLAASEVRQNSQGHARGHEPLSGDSQSCFQRNGSLFSVLLAQNR